MLSRQAHQFFDAVAVAAFGDNDRIERPVGFERFANGVDSGETVHVEYAGDSAFQRDDRLRGDRFSASEASTPSLVLAFRLIAEAEMPSDLASASRMAGKCGPSFGFSAMTIASMCTMRN